MKLKTTITGQEVHNVGYRYFLLANSMNLGISGFNALNSMKGDVHAVVALIEGGEKAVEGSRRWLKARSRNVRSYRESLLGRLMSIS